MWKGAGMGEEEVILIWLFAGCTRGRERGCQLEVKRLQSIQSSSLHMASSS